MGLAAFLLAFHKLTYEPEIWSLYTFTIALFLGISIGQYIKHIMIMSYV